MHEKRTQKTGLEHLHYANQSGSGIQDIPRAGPVVQVIFSRHGILRGPAQRQILMQIYDLSEVVLPIRSLIHRWAQLLLTAPLFTQWEMACGYFPGFPINS